MKTTNNLIIDQFIIETTLVNPLEKIVNQLKNHEFRDCDIKWLDSKLEKFTELACETLGINVIMPINENDKTINGFVLS